MEKLASLQDFRKLRRRLLADIDPERPVLVISAGTCGQASGANDIIRAAKRALLEKSLAEAVGLRITGCQGWCEMEPSILLEPGGAFYPQVKPEDVGAVVDAAARGETVEAMLYQDPESGRRIERAADIPFFRHQQRDLMGRNEKMDPIRIFDCIAAGGYEGLARALEEGDPAWVLGQVKASRLRGRGGAGFPTGVKWEMLARQDGARGKYVVCNADEGDPGAYMDRSVLEGNPHSILEGMTLGALATGADRGVLYVRNEYPLAIKHLLIALRQARELGLLGPDILGTGFSFELELVRGAGAFVCGEETALIRSIEGKMGEPRQRPPFPVERGIHGRPTVINNVETWANVPRIIAGGAEAFARTGTENSTGTKIFSLVGKVRNTGLVEVPMGMKLSTLLHDIGGGAPDGGEIKAVQTGGPSGGCIPAERFDLPIDYDSLREAGSIMGSGGLIVMDRTTCMVDVAKYFMAFLKDESCGKCFTCRKGTQRMHEILEDITLGRGAAESLELLEELALVVKDTTLCGLGQTAPNPVLSTLRYFRDEYLDHIEAGRCPAGVCRALIAYVITDDCTGCGACARACPEGAISGEKKEKHAIDPETCIQCGACLSVCKHGAVAVRSPRALEESTR